MKTSKALKYRFRIASLWNRIAWVIFILIAFQFLSISGRASPPLPKHRLVYVGMILGKGGLGDRSFNDSAYAGLKMAHRLFGIRFRAITHTSDELNMKALRNLLDQGYDLVIGVGYENAGYVRTLARKFPDRKFAVVDIVVQGDNVSSIVFREHEGDFLMGVLAAMLTKTKRVGFIGGMDIDVIRRIQGGFRQGVEYQDKTVEVISDMAGTFADPEIGRALALTQYRAGVDVIYNAAGRTGLGIIHAAKEAKKLTIGTSGDQRHLAPGHVVGNRPKRVDRAILLLVEDLTKGRFTPGVQSLGLAEGGLGLGPFDENIVTPSMVERLEALKQMIIERKLLVKPN
ncbi:MAG: BMP family ABC transporter substrate-binding protein [Deltaproteobacteria bacterium]|nr:BMP family ABC transporter substrate-binding protein [Deltaproteobacteria bacterium]